jgi:adenylate kinase
MPKVIIIYGPPGSGKGTQARKVAEYFNLEHFDTGRLIEKKVHDPALQDDPIIQRERKNFETGKLCTPEWAAQLVKEEVKKVYQMNKGLVFSGSPRTLPEAKELIPVLEELYKKENIYVLKIEVKPETSIFRNSNRRVCKKCGHPLIYSPENEKLEKCPKCGGELVKRVLDKPEVIKVRLKEFEERTEPIYKLLEERNIRIIEIDGEPSVEEVYQNILKVLE